MQERKAYHWEEEVEHQLNVPKRILILTIRIANCGFQFVSDAGVDEAKQSKDTF